MVNNSVSKLLTDVFFGTDQSKYAAIAIFITIAILCFFILFSSTDISVSERMVIIFFILLTAVPSILFSLFELTCIVTGGSKNTRWWCYWLAWFISIVIIIYCLLIIISMFFSMASYDVAMTRINENDDMNKISSREANDYARNIMIANTDKYENSVESKSNNKKNNNDMVMILEPSESFDTQETVQPVVQSSAQPKIQKMSNMSPNNNTLDNMGYDSSDNYASISGFQNSPTPMPMSQPPKISGFQNSPTPMPMSQPPKISGFQNSPKIGRAHV